MSREFSPKPEPTVAQRFSPEQSPSVHKYFSQIMATSVPLYEIAAKEKSSPEKAAAQLVEAMAETSPVFQGLKDEAKKLMEGRRDFFDQLIQTTGGGDETGVPLRALKLESFVDTKSYIDYEGTKSTVLYHDIWDCNPTKLLCAILIAVT